jgi:hypothetical protein
MGMRIRTAIDTWLKRIGPLTRLLCCGNLHKKLAGNEKQKRTAVDKQRCMALTTAANNNLRLMVQTDKKAQILIRVNALMVSLLLTFSIHIPEKHRLELLAVIAQTIACLAVIVLSLAVTRPKLGKGRPMACYAGADENLLFFGMYTKMDREDYVLEMKAMFDSGDDLYSNLILYSFHQARILGKKYKYLRLAYGVFSAGLASSVITSTVLAFL